MNIWMMVTSDEFELPLAVADSASELAEICGVKANIIYSSISHHHAKGFKRCKWVCVKISEGD